MFLTANVIQYIDFFIYARILHSFLNRMLYIYLYTLCKDKFKRTIDSEEVRNEPNKFNIS